MNDYSEQAESIRNYIIERCKCVEIDRAPYPHMVIDNFFPPDVARKIDALFPDTNQLFFDTIDDKSEQKRYRRSFFNNDANKPILECILDEVFDIGLLKKFLEKFNIVYDEKYVWAAHYAWDYSVEGCAALPPHVDVRSKVLSFVYYVPTVSIVNGKLEVQKIPGTDILIRNDDGTFTEHTCIEAKRNRCFVFERSEHSWHAVKETKTPRRTITIFIVDKYINDEVKRPFLHVK